MGERNRSREVMRQYLIPEVGLGSSFLGVCGAWSGPEACLRERVYQDQGKTENPNLREMG